MNGEYVFAPVYQAVVSSNKGPVPVVRVKGDPGEQASTFHLILLTFNNTTGVKLCALTIKQEKLSDNSLSIL